MDIKLAVFLSVFGVCVYFWVGFGVAVLEAKIKGGAIRLATTALWPIAAMVYATGFGL